MLAALQVLEPNDRKERPTPPVLVRSRKSKTMRAMQVVILSTFDVVLGVGARPVIGFGMSNSSVISS